MVGSSRRGISDPLEATGSHINKLNHNRSHPSVRTLAGFWTTNLAVQVCNPKKRGNVYVAWTNKSQDASSEICRQADFRQLPQRLLAIPRTWEGPIRVRMLVSHRSARSFLAGNQMKSGTKTLLYLSGTAVAGLSAGRKSRRKQTMDFI